MSTRSLWGTSVTVPAEKHVYIPKGRKKNKKSLKKSNKDKSKQKRNRKKSNKRSKKKKTTTEKGN